MTTDFDANNDDPSVSDSKVLSVPDTPTFNSNTTRSKEDVRTGTQ